MAVKRLLFVCSTVSIVLLSLLVLFHGNNNPIPVSDQPTQQNQHNTLRNERHEDRLDTAPEDDAVTALQQQKQVQEQPQAGPPPLAKQAPVEVTDTTEQDQPAQTADQHAEPDSFEAKRRKQLELFQTLQRRDNSRLKFAEHLQQAGIDGPAVEIGVFDGDFAEVVLKHRNSSKYYMVDIADRTLLSQRVRRWQSIFGKDNIVLIIKQSTEAAKRFPDGYFHWIYIDANHGYDAVSKDIEVWYPKLAPGGLMSGHDFCVNKQEKKNKQYHAIPFCGYYSSQAKTMYVGQTGRHKDGKPKASQIEVVKAVRDAANRFNVELFWTYEGRDPEDSMSSGWNANPSWYWFKPME